MMGLPCGYTAAFYRAVEAYEDERICDHGMSLDLDCEDCEARIHESYETCDHGASIWPE